MTDLTIDMVESLSSARRPRQKAATAKPAADNTPDRSSEGGGASRSLLEQLLSRGKEDRPADPSEPPSNQETHRSAPCAHGDRSDPDRASAPDGDDDVSPSHERTGCSAEEATRPDDEGFLEGFVYCLRNCTTISFHRLVGDEWEAASTVSGRSCRIRCAPLETEAAYIEIDTGYRVRPGRIRAANLFAMMANGILRQRGFKRIGPDGAVRYGYTASCHDTAVFEHRLRLALACCEEAIRLFGLVSLGTSPKKAFSIYEGSYDELDDFDFESVYDADFDPWPHDKTDE